MAPYAASAQVGSTTDIVMGRVTTPEGTPLAGARVLVTSAETQITRTKVTDADGRYSILFPDGGGSYRVQVTSIGYAPQAFNLVRQADEDRLVRDVTMGRNATVLQSVQVRAQPARQGQGQRPEAGSTERGLPPGLVNRLPVEAGDLNALATLAPGVVGIAGTDSTPASFSVAGQPSDQNSITLDGLSFGAGSVPQEAVRNTRVITSTYDVARGQFTGGQVASTTRGGTNVFQGAVNYSLRDPSLEFVDDPESAFAQKYTQNQISGGFGGPIIKNKLFTFGAVSFTRRTDPLQSLLAADPLALQRLGTNGDSVTRFIGLLNQFGLQPTSALIPEERLNDNASALVRVDYTLGEANTLMLRGDWRGSVQDASRISPFAVPHSGGNAKSSGGGGMITLTSHWSSLINELRAYRSVDSRNTDPYVQVPSGRVVVASNLPDGSLGVSTLQFGVNPALPQESKSFLTELSDELSRVSRNGAHRIKLGGLLNQDRSTSGSFNNALGTYTFNSLADFEAGHPASFTRTVARRDRNARSINGALYLGDSWRKSPKLQLTYGARLEASKYPDAPPFNAALDSVFGGVRTDRFPSEVHVSPRAGFTYTYGR
ncbi:MAG TPA: carboxypeptidase regulatory-like domain-containing protein, partial [Gemmatimonadaceae bacterium]|nr:carboxypeptidase regulatory-like domain-containing protein [Gemmatimonadaceae bacterium]